MFFYYNSYLILKKSIGYIKYYGLKSFIKKCKTRFIAYYLRKDGKMYKLWIAKNEPREDELKKQRKQKFTYEPKISIITPVYNTPKKFLIEMIESVLKQTYANYELCIADGGSVLPHIKEILIEYSQKYKRIKVKFLKEKKGIAGNSNEALSLATGEFIALLDHDDILPPFAFYEIIKIINENPDIDFIYSDRDKITVSGARFDPFFKPDWSPDYLLSQNYVCHLNVFRKSLIDEIKGFREGYDGAQDYDLVLRITALTDKIMHIPKILYHWRVVAGSAAGDPDAKPYAYMAAVNALQDAISKRGWEGKVSNQTTKGLYKVKFKTNGNPKVSIIIPSRDKVEVLSKCVNSILTKTIYLNYEVILVDNQSNEAKTIEYYKRLEANPKIKILEYRRPFNFSEVNNFAVSKTETDYLLFLNNDTEVITKDWIETMVGFAQRKETGAVGAKLIYPNGTIQHAGLILGAGAPTVRRSHHKYFADSLGYGGRIQSIQNLSAIAAACMMVRKRLFEEVGGFDPNFVVAHGDIDFCLKIRSRNYLIVYIPYVELYHFESYTRGYEDTPKKIKRFNIEDGLLIEKWGDTLKKGDPYYSKNLTLEREDFSIRY